MYWLYKAKGFSVAKRQQLFIRKFIRHYKKFVRYNFCCDLPETPESDKELVIKALFNVTENVFEINFDKFWDIAFSYLQKKGLNLSDITGEIITSPMIKLYIADSDLKPLVSSLDWFQAKGYVGHKSQDHYHLWWLRMAYKGLSIEQKKNKTIRCVEQGHSPLEICANFIL